MRTHRYDAMHRVASNGPRFLSAFMADDRVVVELPAVVDAAQARAAEEVVLTEDLEPQVVDRLHLREEPVATDVEAPAVAHRGAADAADDVVGLEHRGGDAPLGEHVGGGEPGGAGTDDHDLVSGFASGLGRGLDVAHQQCSVRAKGRRLSPAVASRDCTARRALLHGTETEEPVDGDRGEHDDAHLGRDPEAHQAVHRGGGDRDHDELGDERGDGHLRRRRITAPATVNGTSSQNATNPSQDAQTSRPSPRL